MRILVDTQCWVWVGSAPERLSRVARDLLADPANDVLVSSVTAWEVAIKFALGRLTLPEPPHTYVPSRMQLSGALPLPIEHVHALEVARLPMHHRDPFDRLLIAQAQIEGVAVMTADRKFEQYEVEIIWASG